jgi:hypothetical protein
MHVEAAFISTNLLFRVILAGSVLAPFLITVVEINDVFVVLLWSISTDDLSRISHGIISMINLKTGMILTEWLLLKRRNGPIFIPETQSIRILELLLIVVSYALRCPFILS